MVLPEGSVAVPPTEALGPIQRMGAFLRAHPIVCLLLLTPGIPEYLSSSSPLSSIVLNPVMFVFQLAANLALYGPGVLLIREAKVRWDKGWASVLLLGAAYGILEEGIGLSTLFNPNANPVGKLGVYGHWLGVSWVWVAGILPVHMLYSISIPILLLGIALPETAGRSLLSRRGMATVSVLLAVDVTGLFLLTVLGEHFWMGWPVFVSSFAAMGVLVMVARRLPKRSLMARAPTPTRGARAMFVAGLLFYPCVLLTEGLGMAASLPAWIDLVFVVLIQGLFLFYVVRVIGSWGNDRNLLALTLGLILPIAFIGVVAEIRLPFTLAADVLMVWFFRRMLKTRRNLIKSVDSSSSIEPAQSAVS